MKDARGHGSNARGGGQTPVQSENAPFVSRLGAAAGHSYLDPRDPRGADQAAAAHLAAGVPASKSGPAPAHSAMSQPTRSGGAFGANSRAYNRATRFAKSVRQAFRNSDG